jgi:glycylpeptide N-tetradecanoyltransferase
MEPKVKEVYDLLSLNYVEDDDASFRFQYSAEFLHWWVGLSMASGCICRHGTQGSETARLSQGMAYWRACIVKQETSRVYLRRTYITPCPWPVSNRWSGLLLLRNLLINHSRFEASEINYLCVHKKLRSKRLAPVLIKEVTRQCHLKGVFQAIYTAGVVLPTPVSTCR